MLTINDLSSLDDSNSKNLKKINSELDKPNSTESTEQKQNSNSTDFLSEKSANYKKRRTTKQNDTFERDREMRSDFRSEKSDKMSETMKIADLEDKTLLELRNLGASLNIDSVDNLEKKELVMRIVEEQVKKGGNIFVTGFLEIINDNSHGILRSKSLLQGDNDVYVSSSQLRRFNLRKGDFITGQARAAKEGERYLSLLKIEAIDGFDPEKSIGRPTFEKLTPIFPNKQIKLETTKDVISTRMIDLLSPIGNGQRGMLVAPPKSGKTMLLKEIALGIRLNYPNYHLMIVLIGERPEEVTDMRRTVAGAEVFASNFDESPQDQVKVAELALERAKRLVEVGQDVVILMDSLTRLARAYNVALPASGRTLSGGMDPIALYPAKRFYGAARNFEDGGSLTILATALVETGSRMDEVIFEEFKGTGNMELKLSRELSDKRIFPAIDIEQSGTRNEELLLGQEVLSQSWRVRRMLELLNDNERTDIIIQRMRKTKNNTEFLQSLVEN